MLGWATTIICAFKWKRRAEEAEAAEKHVRELRERDRRRYQGLREWLLGVRLMSWPGRTGGTYGLQIEWSKAELARAVGAPEQIAERYGKFVMQRFGVEFRKVLAEVGKDKPQ